ncbi:MAG: hypothetical protein HY678_00695 [Chloroflexi bacterium]|nr:hypothetical protein [Chloroflexota bacterium]
MAGGGASARAGDDIAGDGIHPSSILRAPDDATRRLDMARFIEDLRHLTPYLGDRTA